MSHDDKPFQADKIYEQIERLSSAEARQGPQASDAHLISNLRQVHAEDREIVEHVWHQLNARARTRGYQEAGQLPPEKQPAFLKEISSMQNEIKTKKSKRPFYRFIQLSAAILVVGALVIGMAVLLQRTRQQPGPASIVTVVPSSPTRTPIAQVQTPAPAQTQTQTQTGCRITHPATLTPLSGQSDPAVFYLTGGGGYQALPSNTALMRYDLTSGQTTTLLHSTGDSIIVEARLSPDKQWLLLRVAMQSLQKTALQIMRTDGSMLQTVYENSCSTGLAFGGLDTWSPDGREVAFPDPFTSVSVLDLASGKLQRFILPNTGSSSYQPSFWVDNQHLLITRRDGVSASRLEVELLDITKGTNQATSDLTTITSIPSFCGNLAPGENGAQLFTSACTAANGNCQGNQVQGPSTISLLPASGGASKTVYSSSSRAVTAIASAGPSALLFYIENTRGDLSQDGLWKVNA
jgi:hypothetical protein